MKLTTPMQAGFSSYAVGWWMARPISLQQRACELLDLTVKLGYRRLQIACNLPLDTLSEQERTDLYCRAVDRDVAIEVGARGLSAERLRKYADIARKMGSELLRFVIDDQGYKPKTADAFKVIRDALPILDDANVTLAIENHDRFSAAELQAILSDLDSNRVGICLDTANSLGHCEDTYTVTETLLPHVVNVHLKDVLPERLPHMQGFTIHGTPLGRGMVPVSWVIERLSSTGRCMTATLEHWVPPEDSPDKTIEKELSWCIESSSVMQRLFPDSFRSAPSTVRL